MSTEKRQHVLGIAGMPGGGTHSAAAEQGVPHENGSGHAGFADYLMHVPADLWPNKGEFGKLRRGGDGSQGSLTSRFEFAQKVCVVRDPLAVVATNMGTEGRGRKFYDVLNLMLPIPARTDLPDIDFAALITLCWYREAIAWAGGNFFTIEGSQQHRYKLPGNRMLPVEVYCAIASPSIRVQMATFREEMGYDDDF